MRLPGRPLPWLERSALPSLPERWPRLERTPVAAPPPENKVAFSYSLTMLSLCLVVLLLSLAGVSQLQHWTAQNRLYDEFRRTLAEGSVPIGQLDNLGAPVEPGTPIAQLKIPDLGVDEIVVEGTTSSQTQLGVGHRRDTAFPGQPGVSLLMGRRAAYGGVFGELDRLAPGSELTVTTGQGVATYQVIGVRSEGSPLPVLGPEDGQLVLATASGAPYRPSGVTLVDAQLVTPAFDKPPAVIGAKAIAESEQALKGDRSHAFALAWLVQLLVLLVVAALWSWRRWTRTATWLVFTPVLGTLAIAVASSTLTLLPNLL